MIDLGSLSLQGVDQSASTETRRGYAASVFVCLLVCGVFLSGCDAAGGGDGDDPPNAPSSLSAESESGAVSLQWSAPQADDLEGFNVYRATGTSIDVENLSPVNSDSLVSNSEFTDQGVNNGTTYRYRVTAVDDSDNESAPSDSTVVTPFADPPTRP